jgi:hypothetical protein
MPHNHLLPPQLPARVLASKSSPEEQLNLADNQSMLPEYAAVDLEGVCSCCLMQFIGGRAVCLAFRSVCELIAYRKAVMYCCTASLAWGVICRSLQMRSVVFYSMERCWRDTFASHSHRRLSGLVVRISAVPVCWEMAFGLIWRFAGLTR